MPTVKPIRLSDMTGGINTEDPTKIADNEFKDLQNFRYDKDRILTTRNGSQAFGDTIPDTVTLIEDGESITGWAVADDAVTLTTGTARRGSNSIRFDITVATSGNDKAELSASSLGITLGSATSYGTFWLYVPSGFNTNLTDVKIRFGNDSSNYYEWTLPTLTEGGWNFIKINVSDATSTGSPNTGATMDYVLLQINYSASYTDKTDIRFDSFYFYSSTSNSPVHSFATDEKGYFFEQTDGTVLAIAGCGTNLFEYRSGSDTWEVFKTGLTDNTRFSATMYKDVVYITNGVDNYMGYTGTVITEYAGVPKCKYIISVNDVGFLTGETNDPSVVHYTAANPTDLTTFPSNVVVDEDNGQIITGITNLGPLIVVFKERSTYLFSVADDSIEQIDYDGGLSNDRTVARVENDVYFLSANGVFSLAQRQGTTGSLRSTPISDKIRTQFDLVKDKTIAAAIYWPETNNYYIAVDDEGTSRNRAIYLFSTLTRSWTRYKGINVNQFGIYIDSTNTERFLGANAYGGQVLEVEKGFDDLGNPIEYSIATKEFDFGIPSTMITYQAVDFLGFHSEQSSMEVTTSAVITQTATRQKTINYSSSTDGSGGTLGTLGAKTLGSTPLGGVAAGDGSSLTLYPFLRRQPLYLTGRNITFDFEMTKVAAAFQLTKLNIYPVVQPKDFIPTSQYL